MCCHLGLPCFDKRYKHEKKLLHFISKFLSEILCFYRHLEKVPYCDVTKLIISIYTISQILPTNCNSMPFSFVGNPQSSSKIGERGLQPIICLEVTEQFKQLILKETEFVKNLAGEVALGY